MHYAKADLMSAIDIDLFCPVHLPGMEIAAAEAIQSGQIASGPKVSQLEQAFAAIAGREHIVATNDLTSSVTLALHLAGVSAGDDVATVAFSCLQSNSPIAHLGANPIWIDIDLTNMSMSVEDLSAKLGPSVKAVMVYHIAGYPSNISQIAALCRDRGVPLIEDCNNAIGASVDGLPVGMLGDYAVFSLYPNRQINGIDGGMLATPNMATAVRAKRLRRFGIDALTFRDGRGEINPLSDIPEIGWSASLSNLNAAVALSQFDTLKSRMARTQFTAVRLRENLKPLKCVRPINHMAQSIPAYWTFLALSDRRNELLAFLRTRGIRSSILHQRNDWYTGFGASRADLPGTDIVMDQLIALPCGWWLKDAEVDKLIQTIHEFDNN